MDSYVSPQYLICDEKFMDPSEPTGLWFCENALDASAVSINAVCLSFSGTWDDVTADKAFIEQYPYILVVCADRERRAKMVEELRRRVTVDVLVAVDRQFRGCGSAAELGSIHGQSKVFELLYGAEETPVYGLIDIADIKPLDVSKIPRSLSGIRDMDKATGGFMLGDVSVWTGRRGDGKSTLLSQILLDAIDQGNPVCAYSGELNNSTFSYWMSLQAAGFINIGEKRDAGADRSTYFVKTGAMQLIGEWWRGKLKLFDMGRENIHDEAVILDLFRYAARRYGCNTFLVDNIMTARLKTDRNTNQYQAQSAFIGSLVDFAKAFDSHIHIIAHPRKAANGTGREITDADDIGGNGDITNRAGNVFSVQRLNEKDSELLGCDTVVKILKNRIFGGSGKIKLNFEPVSKRYYSPHDGDTKHYGWEYMKQQRIGESNADIPEDWK